MNGHLIRKVPSSILHVTEEMLFFPKSIEMIPTLWSCQKVCEALTFLLDNIYIRCGTKLFRRIVGILLATNCAPLICSYSVMKETS